VNIKSEENYGAFDYESMCARLKGCLDENYKEQITNAISPFVKKLIGE
jgi:hypothetical protein